MNKYNPNEIEKLISKYDIFLPYNFGKALEIFLKILHTELSVSDCERIYYYLDESKGFYSQGEQITVKTASQIGLLRGLVVKSIYNEKPLYDLYQSFLKSMCECDITGMQYDINKISEMLNEQDDLEIIL